MYYPFSHIAMAILPLAGKVLSQAIVPHLDGQCAKPVKNITTDGSVQDVSVYDNTKGWPSFSYYSSPGFGGAASTTGSGNNVYWQIGQPGPGCRAVIMTLYSQGGYGSLGFAAPPGNVIVNAKNAGCYFSNIPVNADLMSTFCCGTGDCGPLSAGDAALVKRDPDEGAPLARRDTGSGESSDIEKRTTLSLTGKAAHSKALDTRDNDIDPSTCKVTAEGDSFPSAGQQVLVANPQTCSSGQCSFSVDHGVTVGTSLTTSQEQTITNTKGQSEAITAGVNFVVSSSVTATFEQSVAKSVATSTGTEISNSTTVTVTNTVGQQVGTTAFVTFTPTYLCWLAKVDCGNGVSAPFNFCQPQLGPNSQSVEGDYTVVYTG